MLNPASPLSRRQQRYREWRWPVDLGVDFARQFTGEQRDFEKILWIWEARSGRANHLFDCAGSKQAMADWLGLRPLNRGPVPPEGLHETGQRIN